MMSLFSVMMPLLGDATPASFLTQILELLFAGFTSTATGMGSGIVSMVTAIFTTGNGTWELNTFGVLIVVFAAISLSLSLFRWVLNFVTSFGNRNR